MRSLTKLLLCSALAGLFASASALAQTPAPAKKENSQQTKMATCNTEAKDLKGDQRKSFMKNCLSGNTSKDGKQLTASQKRMVDCNSEAKTKNLSGDARKTFMSTCLKKS